MRDSSFDLLDALIWIGKGDVPQNRISDERKRNALLRFKNGWKKTGLLPSHEVEWVSCEQCKQKFSYKKYPSSKPRRFCSVLCRGIARPARGKPRKLPTREEVVRLYVEENLPITEIARRFGANHKSVHAQLRRAGIRCRKHTVALICKIEGCGRTAVKIAHKALGVEYGTLCSEHRKIHYRLLNREGSRKRNNRNPSRFNPWRFKENEQERKWIRKSRELLRETRKISLRGLIPPGVFQSPEQG